MIQEQAKFQVGKNGITDNLVEHIRLYVKKHGYVKVRLLKSFVESNDRKESGKELSIRTGTKLAKVVGSSVILEKQNI